MSARATRSASKKHPLTDGEATPGKKELKTEAKVVLAYWNLRGLAQPIRYILEYVKQPYEDKQYQFGENDDRSEWLKEKPNLGFDFPNVCGCTCCSGGTK